MSLAIFAFEVKEWWITEPSEQIKCSFAMRRLLEVLCNACASYFLSRAFNVSSMCYDEFLSARRSRSERLGRWCSTAWFAVGVLVGATRSDPVAGHGFSLVGG